MFRPLPLPSGCLRPPLRQSSGLALGRTFVANDEMDMRYTVCQLPRISLPSAPLYVQPHHLHLASPPKADGTNPPQEYPELPTYIVHTHPSQAAPPSLEKKKTPAKRWELQVMELCLITNVNYIEEASDIW